MIAFRFLVPALLILGCSACSFADRQDFDRYLATAPVQMSQGEAPKDAKLLGMIYAERSGFYLFGYVAVVTANMQNTLDLLVEEARAMKADGISDIKLDYTPASFIAFSDSPLLIKFPWIPYIKVSGMAWKKIAANK